MKKALRGIILFLSFFLFINITNAKEAVMYFFYGEGCPHCAEEEILLDTLNEKYPDLTIRRYEVWYDSTNQKIMNNMKKELGVTATGVPLTIVGSDYAIGYSSSSADRIEKMITDALKDGEKEEEKNTIYNLPLIGKVDVKKVSIPILAIIIGLADGFNPCAMWVLLFLISSLIGLKDKKRMWILGTIFIGVSALMYLLIMFSWLEIIVSVGLTTWIKYIIAGVAIIGSIFNIRSYLKSKNNGCTVVDDKKRKKTFEKIKKFTAEKSYILAIIGVIGLAISVNFIELACSAGLPLIFTEILNLNNITGITSVLYILLYIFFFLIDDLIIFIIAMITFRVTGISTKYTRYSHLIGGIIMFLIGLLLIFKPEWIMFNF